MIAPLLFTEKFDLRGEYLPLGQVGLIVPPAAINQGLEIRNLRRSYIPFGLLLKAGR